MKKKRILTVSGITVLFGSVIIAITAAAGRNGTGGGSGSTVISSDTHYETVSGIPDVTKDAISGTSAPAVTEESTPFDTEPVTETDAAETAAAPHETSAMETGTKPQETTASEKDTETERTESTAFTEDTAEAVTRDETETDSAGETEETGSKDADTEEDTSTDENTGSDNNPDKENSKENHTYTEFTFVKYNTGDMPPDYDWTGFLESKGYISINKKSRLFSFASKLVDELPDTKGIKYIIAPKDAFDDIAKAALEDEAYFAEQAGMDYYTLVCSGISVLKFKKIQDIVNDVTDKSVYALYYYSYLEAGEIAETKRIVSKIAGSITGNEYDRIKAAHDILCALASYDVKTPDSLKSHTAYGALVNGICVCEGYAKAYKLIMDEAGIPCNYVSDSTHAWNEVMLDGKWYVVDVTNDDTGRCYDYFLLGRDTLMYTDEYGYRDGNNTSSVEISEYGITEPETSV